MKRKFIKVISCLLVSTLILALLNGCYNNSKIDNENNDVDLNYEDYNAETEAAEENQTEHLTKVPDGYIAIYNVDDLDYIKSSSQYNYILMNDLDFNEYKSEWDEYDINGVFEGNNYTISNYKSNHPFLRDVGAIYRLTLNNASVNGLTYSATGGYLTFYSSLLCREIIGVNDADINMYNCTVNGNISITWDGKNKYLDDISLPKYENRGVLIGGLCSETNADISSCSFNGTIDVNYTNPERKLDFSIGGITATLSDSTIFYCNTSGKMNLISNNDYCKFNVGGITGKWTNESSIQSCGNSAEINGNTRSSSYGGIVGGPHQILGGGYVTKSFNRGNITSTSKWNQESLYTLTSLGGIVGSGWCSIENCYNAADVKGGENAGGIIGETGASDISKVYNIGDINCNKYKRYDMDETDVFHKGGIIGVANDKNYGSLNYCYYTNDDINAVYDNPKFPYVQHISKTDSKNKDLYQGFNFDDEWEMGDNDYPYPKLTIVDGQ